MHPVPNKNLWWFVLFTCVVSSAAIVCVLIDDRLIGAPRRSRMPLGVLVMVAIYVALAFAAIKKLKIFYTHFGHWDGAWQLSMLDLLSIAFYFGILMLIFRAVAPPQHFVRWIPAAGFLAAGYAASLLVVSKMGYYHTYGRWIEALLGLWVALVAGFTGMALHLCCCSALFFWVLR